MSKRILVVDDEADTNTALHEILEQNGFIVDSYGSFPCFRELQTSLLRSINS